MEAKSQKSLTSGKGSNQGFHAEAAPHASQQETERLHGQRQQEELKAAAAGGNPSPEAHSTKGNPAFTRQNSSPAEEAQPSFEVSRAHEGIEVWENADLTRQAYHADPEDLLGNGPVPPPEPRPQ